MVDRFYLGKMVDDLNAAMARTFTAALGEHLLFFLPMDRSLTSDGARFKLLRYVFALAEGAPVARLLALRETVDALCARFRGPDLEVVAHFGHDDWQPPEGDGGCFGLQFYVLDALGGVENTKLWAGLNDDPEHLDPLAPRWLDQKCLRDEDLADAVLRFAMAYVTRDAEHLNNVRRIEAAFWRMVNLACVLWAVDDIGDLVGRMPVRHREDLAEMPQRWAALRQTNDSSEAFVAVSRLSLRFAQFLLAQGDA